MAPAISLTSAAVALAASVLAGPIKLDIDLSRRQVANPGQDLTDGVDFPDPTFWIDPDTGGVYLAATEGNGYAIPGATSTAFTNTEYTYSGASMLSQAGTWATGNFWAPDLGQLTDYDNSFYMYYSAQVAQGYHCLGLARSANTTGPQGPYTDGSTSSWICPGGEGGAIDPSGFLDGSTRYFAYKIDGNSLVGGCGIAGAKTPLMLQQTTNDGYTLVGTSSELYNNDGESDGYNIEAPSICRDSGGTYYLFFSSNCYSGTNYKINYVSASSVGGPYSNRKILLQSGDYGLTSPGGADVAPDCSAMVFHAYPTTTPGGVRPLYAAQLTASGGTVSIYSG